MEAERLIGICKNRYGDGVSWRVASIDGGCEDPDCGDCGPAFYVSFYVSALQVKREIEYCKHQHQGWLNVAANDPRYETTARERGAVYDDTARRLEAILSDQEGEQGEG